MSMHSARTLVLGSVLVLVGGTASAADPPQKPASGDASKPPPGGAGPGPGAGIHGPETGTKETDPAKPASNPWARAGVTAIDTSGNSPSSAPPAEASTGPELGARVGYMIPLGSSVKDASLGDTVSGALPLMLDAGYRFLPQLYVGLYGQFAFAFLSDKACPGGASCSGNDLRFGVNVHYHFTSGQPWDVWVGAGAGYEILNYKISTQAGSADGSARGLELANLQLGFDYFVEPQVRVGPFVGFSFGQYSSVSLNGSSGDVKDKALHEWLSFGVRGAFDF